MIKKARKGYIPVKINTSKKLSKKTINIISDALAVLFQEVQNAG